MGDFDRPEWSGRLRRVWRTAPDGISTLVVSSSVNIQYLTGFNGSAGLLVTTPAESWLLLDGRYAQSARTARAAGDLAPVDIQTVTASFDEALQALATRLPPGPIGFEAAHVSVATLRVWQHSIVDRVFEPTTMWIERLRVVKDAAELDRIARACTRLSGVARGLGALVKAGRTEREVARNINEAMDRAGFSKPAFETIVASGPNSALPHARPTDRVLKDGDLVVLDFGGVLDGYCGDLTRMAGIGQVGAEARAMYEAVRAAHGAALAAVRAETLASDVDAAARRVLTTHGFGDAILHATGHGLGLEVHEAPRLGRQNDKRPEQLDRLAAGMVCTIEPGAYVEGLGGVRLEDDVVVTAAGCEVLTDAPLDLLLV